MMKKFFTIMVIAILAGGCEYLVVSNEFLLSQEEISLSWKNAVQIKYDQASYQIGYNDKNIEYRVYDDKIANWFTLRCSEKPETEGQTIMADVEWTGSKSTKTLVGQEFKVEKIGGDGLVWLSSSANNIGIVIKNIK